METKVKPQTVRDLKKALDKLDDSLPLIYAIDSEGNAFKYVYFSAEQMCYNPETEEISRENKKGFIDVVCIN